MVVTLWDSEVAAYHGLYDQVWEFYQEIRATYKQIEVPMIVPVRLDKAGKIHGTELGNFFKVTKRLPGGNNKLLYCIIPERLMVGTWEHKYQRH